MSDTAATSELPISLSGNALARLGQTLGRGALRHCPYCGGGQIFENWFTLKERCPHCHTRFAKEQGYFLGSYVMNIGVTELLALILVVWMIVQGGLSVLEMQIVGVALAVGLPIVFYPYALSMWMALDLLIHPPRPSATRQR